MRLVRVMGIWAALVIVLLMEVLPPGPKADPRDPVAPPGPAAPPILWPRFPLDPKTRIPPVIAVVYSSDFIGPHTTLADLGYPGRLIFRLHEDHPLIRMVLMSSPANRYSGERTVLESPEASRTWTALALEEKFEWIELGNMGFTHSPPGDENLDHHEFSTTQSGCNLDHSYFDSASYLEERMTLIRSTYRELGLEPRQVSLIRFPGHASSPAARGAALSAGFIASLGVHGAPYRESWFPAADSHMLEIPDSRFLGLFARSAPLEQGLITGRISAAGLVSSPEFSGAVARGREVVDAAAAGGGILNLADRWSDTFAVIGGVRPRYLVLDAVLDDLETRYAGRIWYPRGRDLALWLMARRVATTKVTMDVDGTLVEIQLPPVWTRAAGRGLEGSTFIVPVPGTWQRVGEVRVAEGRGGWSTLDPSRYWLDRRGLVVVLTLTGSHRIHVKAADPVTPG